MLFRSVAYLQPLQHAGQNLLSHALTISPQPAQQRNTLDVYGNTRCFFSLQVPHPVLEVQAMSIVSTSAQACPTSAQPWEQLRDRLRYQAHTPFEAASEFVFASPFVPRRQEFSGYARPSFVAGASVLDVAGSVSVTCFGGGILSSCPFSTWSGLVMPLAAIRSACETPNLLAILLSVSPDWTT